LAGILPLCAGGSRALPAVQRAATLRRSILRRLLSPHHLAAPDLTPWRGARRHFATGAPI
jgi:hypothetical protein